MAKSRVIVKILEESSGSKAISESTIASAVANIFSAFGGGKNLLKSSKDVYIKPNAIDSKPHCYTRPDILKAMIEFFFQEGANHVYVMENSTQNQYTRIVFEVTGYHRVLKDTGAKPIYLDEQKTETVEFPGKKGTTGYDLVTFEMPKLLVDRLIRNKDQNLYVDVPKLKTHSMAWVTLGIKNQWAFVAHKDRRFDHNYNLHSKLVDVFQVIQPDFTVIDGIEGTIYGHYPPAALAGKCVIPFHLLIGGNNTVATDIVGARVFGYAAEEIPHIKIAIDRGLSQGVKSIDDIDVAGEDLSRFTEKYSHDLYPQFPADVTIMKGKTMACKEGCQNNPLAVMQMLSLDFHGKGEFTIVMGKGHVPAAIDNIQGPVLVAGHCAIEETRDRLIKRLGKGKVYASDGCNNLVQTTMALCHLMKVDVLSMVPLKASTSLGILLKAKWHKSQANVPSIMSKYIKKV
nr:DUF362 domain-containing protein [Candidatus Sigynarchaeota archaeon]